MFKFPIYKQLDSSDCGSTCLRMIAKYYGKTHKSKNLRNWSFTTRSGASFAGLINASEEIGFDTSAVKVNWAQLLEVVSLPCIVHWNKNHFIVVYKITKSKNKAPIIYVADPAIGKVKIKKSFFLEHWSIGDGDLTGFVLILKPTKQFYEFNPKKENSFNFKDFFKYLLPFHKPLIQFILTMLLGSLISLVFPFLTQGVVDIGIGRSNLGLIQTLLVAQLLLTIGQLGNDLVRSFIMVHLSMRISISVISDFLHKLTKLPISFFDSKKIGDIMQRIGDNTRIQSFLTGSLISTGIALITFIVYSVVMASYNIMILFVFLIGSIIYIIWIFLFLKKRKSIDINRFNESASNQSNIIQLITGMQEIKLNNCEQSKICDWEKIQMRLYQINTNSRAVEETQNVGGVFIDQIKNVVISYIAAKLVIENEISLGVMMAMQYIIGQLNAPLRQFIGFVQNAQDAIISMERLGEVYNKENEESDENPKLKDVPANGDIKFENVVFQYEGATSKKVLDNVSFTIHAGKINAIVGISGSGKTTIFKLLLGFYKPISGCILLNNNNIHSYSDSKWRQKCGVVMQDGFIFSDTIKNNIGLKDENPDMERIKYSVNIANLSSYIEDLPLGYNTMIGMEGAGISTGQKQRILIARSVYKDPNYIFFDEATNALDSNNEKNIMENLQIFFKDKTVVIVAHRLSTVKKADNIIVIDNGKIAETGTHNQLLKNKGNYYNLIKNQLEIDN